MCSASLAISIGSIALLPFSVVSSELLQRYPDNYYLQWMSWSLINSLWNYVFALSNLSLFVLLPFSYFFIESQGFSKNKNGIMQRVYETLAVCALLIVVILCLADVVLTLISSSVSLISITSVNLPLIYSFVSFAGVMLLLLLTPIGFAKMFGIVGEMTMICLIIFITLYLLSYWIISLFKSKSDNDSLYSGDEDYFVYRISVWMCSASLAISIGSIALLPFSVVSSELLQRYPDNYYLQWMSWSLINSLWNYVFALSNLSLFVLLPFSYFFIESQGFSKNKNGIMQRVYETLAVCALLIVVILCLADVVLTLISSSVSLISITSVNLPLIYSFVSFAGVMLLLLLTPIGFAKMFGIVGEMTMNSISMPDQDDIVVNRLEKYCKERAEATNKYGKNNNIKINGFDGLSPFYSPASHGYSPLRFRSTRMSPNGIHGAGDCGDPYYLFSSSVYGHSPVSNVSLSSIGASGDWDMSFSEKRQEANGWSKQRDSNGWANGSTRSGVVASQFWTPLHQKSLRWCQQFTRIVKYPAIVISLLALTGISLLMVVINSLKLMFGFRSLPVYAQYMEVHTRHSLGIAGVIIESITIMYVMATSLTGLYSMPFVRALRPRRRRTSLTVIIINCSLILVLSSALPVLANTLGITSFDLLGAYSSLKWLSNFKLVLAYNVLFAAATIICVFSKITSPVRKQILRRLQQLRCRRAVDDEASVKIE
ncbi:LMBR1-like region [Ancylostoma duodenale]|uniref:LMBR1-like region n=1 Tax=Ancylostoma duodenale TaxID=51022 RepID=A0A0C2CUN6_9BILA|nr:LMBR1-like region [Ancylostoma duodenale]